MYIQSAAEQSRGVQFVYATSCSSIRAYFRGAIFLMAPIMPYFCIQNFPANSFLRALTELFNCSLFLLFHSLANIYSCTKQKKGLFKQKVKSHARTKKQQLFNRLQVVTIETCASHHWRLHSETLPGDALSTLQHISFGNVTAKMASTLLAATVSPPTRSIYFDKNVLC